jgi:hypothetical protein
MNFELNRVDMVPDVDNNDVLVEIAVTEKFRCELTSGTFYVYHEVNGIEHCMIEQPWNFDSEGNRIDWTSLEEALDWFKSQHKHIGV